ncbi:polysaccharide biosynthesis protein [Lactobacillus sp. ESL0236]|uniref:oligosaccharide flippase family protein n=1 Tax=unclassified Lactobacillus TaxID=2620435 RepID=UPI000EFD2DC1|nr:MULTISPECIES: oligosaccharide flippase family protein [unclassified Lactobacillus]RMC40686.1 polysaccharide biosynthesis protein [Lactobacillus sp. ESL0237]RMC44444.1 polysaccharide biosynthesis protein [Lactobacillus sp. ESL0234]RMC45750.1 polysaccharide biosynthesis protein [Lactobacillus sp. ESL0236]
MKRTFLNILYNAVYQIFLVLVPLITVPYLSRILGPHTYGIYSNVNNIVQFLMIFCTLSVSYIGMRTISQTRSHGNQQELTKVFWGLWYFQAIAGAATIIILLVVVGYYRIKYGNYLLLMIPYLISAQVDISWFFQGLAEFGRVVLKNTAVKLVSVILILVWVKEPSDLWKYMLIMSVSTLLGSLVFWFDIHRYIGGPVKHFYQFDTTIKAIITLLIPQIATQIYTSLDKPILGLFQNSTQVAFYDNSQRISNMVLGIVTSISLVIMPKMAGEGQKQQRIILKKSLDATVMLGTMFAVIIMANTKEFVPFFFGAKFIPMTPLMFFFALTIIMIPMGGVFANQFALANHRDRDYAIPVIVGAILEVVLSYFLDQLYGATGAMLAILTTELIVLILRLLIVRDGYDFKYSFQEVPKYFLIAGIVLVVGMLLPQLVSSAFFNMAMKSIIMFILYIALMFLLRLDFNQDLIMLFKKFFK